MIRQAYNLIKAHYDGRTAERSGVPLINHIDEGLRVLRARNATQAAMAAYCLHPLVQRDIDLASNNRHLVDFPGHVIVLTMEYRNIANASLAHKVDQCSGPEAIPLSPLHDVNEMLVADKVQNYKDFRTYHFGSHPRGERLDRYFQMWLARLNVTFEEFLEYERMLKR